jgi:hypothetical protein
MTSGRAVETDTLPPISSGGSMATNSGRKRANRPASAGVRAHTIERRPRARNRATQRPTSAGARGRSE